MVKLLWGDTMAYKDKAAAIAYINQYNAENYDRVTVMLPHGEKEGIKEHAAARGEKLNGFIKRAIQETMERDGMEGVQ